MKAKIEGIELKWDPLPVDATTMQSTTVIGFDDHSVRPDDLTTPELDKCIRFIEQSNRTLEVENVVIERYLMRMDPSILFKMEPMFDTVSLPSVKTDDSDGLFRRPSESSTRSFSTTGPKMSMLMLGDKGPRVQPVHRIEIVNRELEELRSTLEEFRERAKHLTYLLRCRKEEISSRLQEVMDSQSYFEDQFLAGSIDPLTGKLPGEKFIRYLENKLVSEEAEIDKIRMKTSSARHQLKRVDKQLALKAELGEVLYAIDFEQLKIENKECQEKLDEKVIHVMETKKINSRYGTILNFNLKKLQEQLNRIGNLEKSIDAKEKMILQLKADENKVNEEVKKVNKSVIKLRKLMDTYEVPDVFDYILEKAELLDLKKEIKICGRQVRLKDLALASQSTKGKDRGDPLNYLRTKSPSKKFTHY